MKTVPGIEPFFDDSGNRRGMLRVLDDGSISVIVEGDSLCNGTLCAEQVRALMQFLQEVFEQR